MKSFKNQPFQGIILFLFLFLFTTNLNAQLTLSAQSDAATEISAVANFDYQTVPGDPLNARIYTLTNGLRVYMTVYKDKPSIQANIAVRAGSKNDPNETTGLAHYFEHMMFKGTKNFGTLSYEKEAKMIEEIESLYENYRTIPFEKEAEREAIFKIIDSISYEASKLAIPNEYDKLMSMIGSSGTNAYTSQDQTVYLENIPANQIENWAKIQADRFSNPVLRLFHTELETIYEEKNMTLANDSRKVNTALLEGLFQKHNYGKQTTIGSQEHIKNPSMKNINWFFNHYYGPNNIAICLSGDFDPDYMIQIIDKYFGPLKPSNVPKYDFEKEENINTPIIKEVIGPDAENMVIGYRFAAANSNETDKLVILSNLLSNRDAGLIDLNLNKKQKVLRAYAYPLQMADYSVLILGGSPKQNQTLEQVQELLLKQINLVKNGEFEEWMIQAIVNDLKLSQMRSYENNSSRASAFVNSFIMDIPWEQRVDYFNRLGNITKADIIEFANKYLNQNYVAVYKKTGVDNSYKKIKKTKLTPIFINRDVASDFYKSIQAQKVGNIAPVYVDYSTDISHSSINKTLPLLYKHNDENQTFSLYYVIPMGTNHNKKLSLAIDYLQYLGSSKLSSEQLQQELFKFGASYSVRSGEDEVYVSLSGLSENFEPALLLFESLLTDPQPNAEALNNLVSDILKSRENAKKNVQSIFRALSTFGIYGPKSPSTHILSETELKAVKADELVSILKNITSFEHKILYYGSHDLTAVEAILTKHHKIPNTLAKIPSETKFIQLPTNKNKVFVVDFPAKQSQILMLSRSDKFNPAFVPTIRLFNEYFGGSMNSIVFQELRESRALAYTARSIYQTPSKKGRYNYSNGYIGTQYDKMDEALSSMIGLMDNMPLSEKSFSLANQSLDQTIRNTRTTKQSVLFTYLANQKLGVDHDLNKDVFEALPKLTFNDIKGFQTKYMKGTKKTILVFGDKNEIDLKMLKKYGKVKFLTLEEIFGY